MAAMVCHGLQSCLESQLVESRALTLSFPFTPKPQQNPIDLPFKTSLWDSSNPKSQDRTSNRDNTNTGWSFLQALSNVSHVSKDSSTVKESVYVHPQAKRSSKMSQKSLEVCTENLGNETGSYIVENNGNEDMDLPCSWPTGEQQEARPREVCLGGIKKTRTNNFPPPLTTMRGSESLRVRRSYREDGSLVVEAIRVPPRPSCFQAERSHGRLRLCFWKKTDDNFDPEDTEASNDDDDDDSEGVDEECESDSVESEGRKQVEESEEEEEEEEAEDDEVEEMRRKEYERPRRCKEGRQHENNDLYNNNWGEPLPVAIS